jgi:hypothetical protein
MKAAVKNISAIDGLSKRVDNARSDEDAPKPESFKQYLLEHARVKGGARYTFEGRRALEGIVDRIDLILGSPKRHPTSGALIVSEALKDSVLAICGGAQWGKSILALQLTAYMTGVKFKAVGYYLPDDDLVQGIVDGKFRPEVIDLMPWYARQLTLGKTLNKSGKAVNRKGAFLVSNRANPMAPGLGMIRGMGKIPTSFSMDVTIEDEKDDIPIKRARFLKGRKTSSDLRFALIIGTQRIAGAGQNKEFEAGTQEVFELIDPVDGSRWCAEDHWPQICRVAIHGRGKERANDPQLTHEGDFKRAGYDLSVAQFEHEAHYYLANPITGVPLNRDVGEWKAGRPERAKERKFSMRISQMGIAAIELVQIVAHWKEAVTDPDEMIVFCTDRLAIPRSSLQQLDHAIIDRSRNLERFTLSAATKPGSIRFAGLDTGDRCWFTAREVDSPSVKRVSYAEQIALGRVKARAIELFHKLSLSCIFIDARPAAEEAREITWAVHGLSDYPDELKWKKEYETQVVSFGSAGLVWDGEKKLWRGLRGAVVEFALKEGQGVQHKLGKNQEGKMFPIIQCNRDETIAGVVQELLTPKEGIVQVIEGKVRQEPLLRLPKIGPGAPVAAELLGAHFLTGSKKEVKKDSDEQHYVDKVENHYLLAAAYARLAEQIGGTAHARPFSFQTVNIRSRMSGRISRGRTALV